MRQGAQALIESGFLRSDREMHNRAPGAGGSRVLRGASAHSLHSFFYL